MRRSAVSDTESDRRKCANSATDSVAFGGRRTTMNWRRIGIPLFVFSLAVTVAGYAAASQMHKRP